MVQDAANPKLSEDLYKTGASDEKPSSCRGGRSGIIILNLERPLDEHVGAAVI
jgi:hypothetical protein